MFSVFISIIFVICSTIKEYNYDAINKRYTYLRPTAYIRRKLTHLLT